MGADKILDSLAVCSWSLQPEIPEDLIAKLEMTGVKRTQLALGPLIYDINWAGVAWKLKDAGVELVSGMFGTKDEDYTTLDTIRKTGGVVPDKTWNYNWRHIQKVIPLAKSLGISLVSFHAGFLPESKKDPDHEKLIKRLKIIAHAFSAEGIDLAFETGQEDALALKSFLENLSAPNVGVNFDPANMILYGKGNPVDAVKILSPYIKQVHIKDALPSKTPGEWGTEVAVGTGAVDWKAFLAALNDGGFTGLMSIEREAGDQRIEDIKTAMAYLQKI